MSNDVFRAVLAVFGILGQEVWKPGVFWYNAGLPENIPDLYFGGPSGKVEILDKSIKLEFKCKTQLPKIVAV